MICVDTILMPLLTNSSHTLPVKPIITNMLDFTLIVYPDGSIWLIQQLPDHDLRVAQTGRAPVRGALIKL